MSTFGALLAGLAILIFALWLALYVTWLFFVKLRRRESPTRSFFAWLRDLLDVVMGLG